MKDLLTIEEFSKITGISKNMLRYWDKIGLFFPAERSNKTKYRHYSLNQIIFVKFILILHKLDVPLKDIETIINNKDPETIIEIMKNQERLIYKKLQDFQEMFSIIYTRREFIDLGLKANLDEIAVVDLPEQSIIMGPKNDFKDKEFYSSFINFCQQANNYRINLNYPIGGYYQSSDDFFNTPNEPHNFFSVDLTEDTKREAGKYLVGYTKGYYNNLEDIAKKMKKYAEDNSIELTGPTYTIYLHDEICVQDTNDYLAQVCIKIK